MKLRPGLYRISGPGDDLDPLRRGSKGPRVAQLQRIFNEWLAAWPGAPGRPALLRVDGDYGTLTDAAGRWLVGREWFSQIQMDIIDGQYRRAGFQNIKPYSVRVSSPVVITPQPQGSPSNLPDELQPPAQATGGGSISPRVFIFGGLAVLALVMSAK